MRVCEPVRAGVLWARKLNVRAPTVSQAVYKANGRGRI